MAWPAPAEDVTQLLQSMRDGDKEAEQRLIAALYRELRTLAANRMSREQPIHILQPTALVNEVYLRMVAPGRTTWNSRIHFLACASRVMQHVLTDHAKQKIAEKRGGISSP